MDDFSQGFDSLASKYLYFDIAQKNQFYLILIGSLFIDILFKFVKKS